MERNMNGIEQITERIKADIQAEADALLQQAEADAADIRLADDKRQQDAYWQKLNAGTREAEVHIERAASMAELESKKQLLAQKQELVSRAFDEALNMLAALPENQYVSMLAGFAAKGAETGNEQLIFSQRDRAAVGKKVCVAANELLTAQGTPANLTMAETSRPMAGGVIVTDGSIDVNFSLEALIASGRDEMTEQVAKILFD